MLSDNFPTCLFCFLASWGQELSSGPAILPFCRRGSINLQWMGDDPAHTTGLWGTSAQLPATPLRWGFSHFPTLHLTSTTHRTQRWKSVSVYRESLFFPSARDMEQRWTLHHRDDFSPEHGLRLRFLTPLLAATLIFCILGWRKEGASVLLWPREGKAVHTESKGVSSQAEQSSDRSFLKLASISTLYFRGIPVTPSSIPLVCLTWFECFCCLENKTKQIKTKQKKNQNQNWLIHPMTISGKKKKKKERSFPSGKQA